MLLTGTDHNIPHPEDAAKLKGFTQSAGFSSVLNIPEFMKKPLPFLEVNFSCRYVPYIGQVFKYLGYFSIYLV